MGKFFFRQEKLSKLEIIDCDLKIDVDSVPTDLPSKCANDFFLVKA